VFNYANVKPMDRKDAAEAFASREPEQICSALVAIAFHDDDWQWVQGVCLQYLESSNLEICAVAATCLGHVARIHGQIDKKKVIAAIQSKMSNENIKGTLEDACDDIESFVKD